MSMVVFYTIDRLGDRADVTKASWSAGHLCGYL
jgi:hypothetical protein